MKSWPIFSSGVSASAGAGAAVGAGVDAGVGVGAAAGRVPAGAAVQAVSFSADGQTVYIKALQQGFDREVAEKLIMGV